MQREWQARVGWLLLVGFLFLLAGCGGSRAPAGPEEGLTPEGYPYMGNPSAPVLIEEFSDFQ